VKIIIQKYNKLLKEIREYIKIGEESIEKFVGKEKVKVSWEIGRLISEHLKSEEKVEYGKETVKRLSKDLGIEKTVLYKMKQFYEAYPKIKKIDEKINWSQYRVLSQIKDLEKRKYLEEAIKINNWDTRILTEESKRIRNVDISTEKGFLISKIGTELDSDELKIEDLKATRGNLYFYKLKILDMTGKKYLDCGFKIFKEIETDLKEQDIIVEVTKKEDKYLLKKSEINSKKMHTYKAYLEKIVDGDTLNVVLDLGFGILHKEIIRLNGVDAPEIKTEAGKISAKGLEEILKNVKVLVLKTIKIDIYGRYVADVFFSNSETDLQKIADKGDYLNEILLEKGFVKRLI
jgi:endonuclease YncB( thermonuclease family)